MTVQAASITWGAPVTIAGDTDVSSIGTLKYAYNLSGTTAAAALVNGVAFAGTTSASGLGADVSITGSGVANYTGFSAVSGSFSTLSAAYQNVLKGGDYVNSTAALTLTLKNLTVGNVYLVQVWVNDSRSTGNARNEIAGGVGGNSVVVDYNNTETNGGVGQYCIGTFTADAATQAFTLAGNSSSQFNALQVRDQGAETRTSGTWNTTLNNQVWGVASEWSNNIIATGSGSTADFSQLDVPSDIVVNLDSTRVIGNVIFGDVNLASAAGWTLANNGVATNLLILAGSNPTVTVNDLGAGKSAEISAVVAGVSGLTKAGAGQLLLSGENIFVGSVVINTGTLTLCNPFAVYYSSNLVIAAGATLDLSRVAFSILGGQTLSGAGTVNGSLSVAPGARVFPGKAGTAERFTFNNNLDLSWGSACYLDLGTNAASGSDQILVGGNLTLGGTIHLNGLGGTANLDTASDYVLISVSGAMSGTIPGLVWDGSRPANYASFFLAVNGNNLVLRYTPPGLSPAPKKLTATSTNNGIVLTWNSSTGANGYNLKRATVSNGPFLPIASGISDTNFLDSNVVSGITYYYVVSAVNGLGEGGASAQAYVLPVSFLKANGCDLCDRAGSGRIVPLHGANLGGWLFFEGWMCPGLFGTNSNPSELDIATNFISRFGLATNDMLLDVWRTNWISTHDLDGLVRLGMNLARFHFTYDSFQEQPIRDSVSLTNMPWKADSTSFKYMDWLITECAKRGIYVVIDYQYPEGNPAFAGAYQDRFIYIWERIAAHYAGNPTVLGYDLWNEAYTSGVPNLFNLAYQAIRQFDPDHPVIMEQCWWGPNGDLSQITQAVTNYNWTNIIGEQHYVAGATISNIVMSLRAVSSGSPAYPVYDGEYMLSGTNYGLPDILAFTGSGALFTSWTLKSVNQQSWSLLNMLDNGPSYNSTYLPDLLNDPASVIASKWTLWRTPASPQINFYQPSLVRMSGPVCSSDAFAVGSNGSLLMPASMLLTNDADLNPSNQLVVASVALGRTQHGAITATNSGYFYQADPGFAGVDTFSYQDLDQRLGLLSVNVGTVALVVGVPLAPPSLSTQGAVGAVNLNWASPGGAVSYNIKRATVTGGPFMTIAVGVTATNFADLTAPPGMASYYVVSAVNGYGEGPNSMVASGAPANRALSPVADAYVRGGSYAAMNFGASPTLDLKNDPNSSYYRQAYLCFNVAGLTNVSQALLYLMPVSAGTPAPAMVVRTLANDTWTELGITWNNQPAEAGAQIASSSGVIPGSPVELDITPSVQAAAAADGLLSLRVQLATPSVNVSLGSRWQSAMTNQPQLLVTQPPQFTLNLQQAGNALQLAWPLAYGTPHLLAQTNEVGGGLGTNWIDLGPVSTPVTLPINGGNGSVFYRLKSP